MEKIDIVSFEGIDGVGKSTIVSQVYQRLLKDENISYEKILSYPEPYYFRDLLEQEKEDNISLLLLFLLSRRKLLQKIIKETENYENPLLYFLTDI